MSHLTINDIDRLCDEFESRWTPDLALERIGDIVGQAAADPSSLIQLAIELCCVDIEQRWREWSNADCLSGRDADAVLEKLDQVPRVAQYLSVLPPQLRQEDAAAQIQRELDECEFANRCKYGDLPSPVGYPGLDPDCVQRVTNCVPVLVVSVSTLEHIKGNCWGTWGALRVGRQRRREPPPYHLTDGIPPKLICARSDVVDVSRNQLRLQVVSPTRATIVNLSTNRGFRVNGRIPVPPAKTVLVSFPISVDLHPIYVAAYRRSASEAGLGTQTRAY